MIRLGCVAVVAFAASSSAVASFRQDRYSGVRWIEVLSGETLRAVDCGGDGAFHSKDEQTCAILNIDKWFLLHLVDIVLRKRDIISIQARLAV